MAQNEQINAVQDTAIEVDAANGVLANDPGAMLVLPLGSWQRTTAGGQISFEEDGSYKYISAPGFAGTDTVQYTTDNAGTGTLTVNVTATALLPFVSLGPQPTERHQVTHGFGQVGNGVITSAFTPVPLAGGGYVVLVDYQDIAAGSTIEVRTYDANHNLISLFDPGLLITSPRVAALPNGGYAFAYGVRDPLGGTLINYAQLFDASGDSLSGPTPFDVPGPLDGISGLSALPSGGFVLLLTGNGGSGTQLYAQSFSAAGVPESQQFTVGAPDQARNPTILPNGEIVLSRIAGSNSDEVHFQRYDLHGNPIGGEITPTSDGHSVPAARTFALTDGGFVAMWMSDLPTSGGHLGPPHRMAYLQVVDANGNVVGAPATSDLMFVTLFGEPIFSSSITPLANGGFVIRWRGVIANGEIADQVQVYDANANAVGSPIFFDALTVFGSERALVFALPDGGFAITLQSANPANHDLLLYDNNVSPIGEVRMHDAGDGTGASSFVLANRPNGDTLVLAQSFSETPTGTEPSIDDITIQTIRFDTSTHVIQPGKYSAAILPVKIYIPDPDGSEIVQWIDVSGVPDGWTLSHPSATATLNAGVWTITGPGIAQGGAIDLHITAPFGTPGSGTLSVVAHTIDTDNGSQNQSIPASFDFANLLVNEPAPFDFNGDGQSDILWQNDNGTPAVWLLDGTGLMTLGGPLTNPGPSWHEKAAADFNGDGKADILWQNDNGTPAVWLMDGVNVLQMGGALANPGPNWKAKEAADFDGDGKADILWQNDNGTAGVWLMEGTSVRQFGGGLNAGANWTTKAAADFNGDGKADILWQNDNGTPAVWLMDGTSVLSTGPALANPGPSWHAAAAGDFNADGKADILWQHDNGTAAVWLMDGVNLLQMGGPLTNPGASWHVQEAADANGDGKADILWQNDNGTPAVWLMDGTSVQQIGGALANPGVEWHIV